MSRASAPNWEEANQACLMAALAEVRIILTRFLSRDAGTAEPADNAPAMNAATEDVRSTVQEATALENLCAIFGLSGFERKILLMCAGAELDSRFAGLYAEASKDSRCSQPTFSLALAAFEDSHWSALLPTAPLRHWHLVEVMSGDALTTSPLRIDERILHYLAGTSSLDDRLHGFTEPLRNTTALPPSQNALAEQIAGSWHRVSSASPVVQLCGGELRSKRAVAVAACARLGLRLRTLSSNFVPRGIAELDPLIRLWEREFALNPTGLLLECDEMESSDVAGETAVKRLLETARTPLLITVREPRKPLDRLLLSFDVPKPTSAEQRQIWKDALGPDASVLNGSVEKLASQFSLDAGSIRSAVAQTLPAKDNEDEAGPDRDERDLAGALWDVCRAHARPRLDGLAQRIEPAADWDDLILPEPQKQLLSQIALHLRQRAKVYQSWGFASKGSRGLGISALFAGPSGTGKTMAGEVLANELRLDLYRIDLSQVISKYIGETEKNLRRVFDTAEDGAAILLFDEADALFGKRSEVKDSHDRYANIEVSYLLQRMEAYRGLAILTTNRKDALDSAFLRRLRFVVQFPFPEAAQRAEIWRRVFPQQTPTEGVRIEKLARLNAAGGHIRNIAMGAAFLAADSGEPVRMAHLLSAARCEFAKLERPLTDAETAGWV